MRIGIAQTTRKDNYSVFFNSAFVHNHVAQKKPPIFSNNDKRIYFFQKILQ